MNTDLGEKIYNLRKKEGLTLEELAKRTESSKSYIWELENKSPPRPSADKLSKIAKVLGVTLDYLINSENTISEADASDEMFYRKFKKMSPPTKEKIKKIVELWEDE